MKRLRVSGWLAVAISMWMAGGALAWGQGGQGHSLEVSAAEQREIQASFLTLFEAMKGGDVAVIEQHSAGAMLSEYKKLFEENQQYPAFLRSFYKGASFSIARVTPTPEGEVIVEVAIQLGGGSRSITKLHAKRFDGSSPTWKVTEVVRPSRAAAPHPASTQPPA
jgi:hypothetical protein